MYKHGLARYEPEISTVKACELNQIFFLASESLMFKGQTGKEIILDLELLKNRCQS